MRLFVIFALALSAGACATRFDTETQLAAAEQLEAGERRLVPVREFADGEALAEVGTLRIPMADIAPGVPERSGLEADRLDRIRARMSRSLCQRLARAGFAVDPVTGTPELEVGEAPLGTDEARLRAVITGVRPNNVATTGISRAIGVAVPGPLNPRVPIGIGALGAEAEIYDGEDRPIAAIRWASQNHLVSGGGVTTLLDGADGFSGIADALDLADVFADAVGDLVTEAREPYDVAEGETDGGTCNAYFDALSEPSAD